MSITHKVKQKENLTLYRTWLTDTDPSSTYFRLTNFPERLTAGKNAFLVNGSEFLEPDTEVLMEILDANGDPIFFQPIKNYQEGLARVVSIEVYQDTPPGLARVTILGRVKTDINGNRPPEEFQTAYNVKWERTISVVPNVQNTYPIRLYHYPSQSVTEVLNPFRQASSSINYLTGSSGLNIVGISSGEAILSDNLSLNTFVIVASTSSFAKQMEGGMLHAVANGLPYTASVITVMNNRMAVVSPSFTSGNVVQEFNTTNFTMSYSGSPDYMVSQYTRSFADVSIKKLTTFTGNIYRIKTHVSSIDSPANSTLVAETQLKPTELMVTSSNIAGQQKLRTGYFTNQSVISDNWVIGLISSQSLYNPS